jgi:hypothetical protein
VPTVSNLKDQARAYEQKGQIRKALAIYQHILRHLEDKPAVVKVLPLYVKVGDLLLKQNQRVAAVASYEKAAEQYAALGSARRVSALCTKIVRADSQRSDVHVHFTRRLIESGHVGSARDVLADYTDAVGLDKASEALDDLAGRPNDEVRPMLERLLDSVGQGERTSAERVAERVSTQLQQVTDDVAGDLIGVTTVELSTGGVEQIEERPELTPPLIDLGFSTSPIVSAKPSSADESSPPVERAIELDQSTDPGPGTRAPDRQEEVRPDATESPPPTPEAPVAISVAGEMRGPVAAQRQPRPAPAPARPARSPVSYGLVGFIVGAVSGAGLMWAIAVPRSDADPGIQPADSAVTATVPTPAEAVDLGPGPAETSGAESSQIDTAGESAIDTSRVEASVTGQLVSPARTDTMSGPDSLLTNVGVQDAANPIVVAGLAIASVTEIEYRGQSGYRVVHLLNSGGVFTVESFPTGTDARPSGNVGRIVVNVTPPDTLVGIVRMERHMVYASAVIPEDSLRALMSRLVEREPAN